MRVEVEELAHKTLKQHDAAESQGRPSNNVARKQDPPSPILLSNRADNQLSLQAGEQQSGKGQGPGHFEGEKLHAKGFGRNGPRPLHSESRSRAQDHLANSYDSSEPLNNQQLIQQERDLNSLVDKPAHLLDPEAAHAAEPNLIQVDAESIVSA